MKMKTSKEPDTEPNSTKINKNKARQQQDASHDPHLLQINSTQTTVVTATFSMSLLVNRMHL